MLYLVLFNRQVTKRDIDYDLILINKKITLGFKIRELD